MVARSTRSALAAAMTLSLAGQAFGQFYTHTSGPTGDGFTWDAEFGGLNNLPDEDQFDTPDGVSYFNFSGNQTFFDSSYQAAGNAPNISGDAWWGNPLDIGSSEVGIGTVNAGVGASSISFDFAWALAGQDAPDFIELQIFDLDTGPTGTDQYETLLFLNLPDTWNAGGAFGGFEGRSGRIELDFNDLVDDFTGEPFENIDDVSLYVGDIETSGGTGEFAVDNVSIDGATGGNGSEVIFSRFDGTEFVDGTTLIANVLRMPGTATFFSQRVSEIAGQDTTYTVTMTPGGDLTPGSLASGDFIFANSDDFVGPLGTLDQNLPSGQYTSEIVLTNDGNPSDPDNNLFVGIALHDAPDLSGSQAVNVSANQQVTLSNAAETPGGRRAGVEIASIVTTGGFSVLDGVTAGVKVLPGQTASSTAITFNRYGKLSKTHNGSLTVNMDMVSQSGFFLTDAQSIDRVYNLSFTLGDTNADTVAFASAEDYGPNKVGVNNANMAATLLAGTASTAQTVTMTIAANPEAGDPTTSADLIGDPLDLTFTAPGDLYVLQFTYDPTNLPAGMTEDELIFLTYDFTSQDWVDALGLNSDGGSGATMHNGSFADFLAGAGGGTLDNADLSAFGVDSANDIAWAVLDHASVFGLGRIGSAPLVPGDADGDGDVDDTDLGIAISNFTGPVGAAGGKTLAQGDTDGDGDVDDTDLGVAISGFTGPLAPTNVPEPASVVVLGALGLLATRRRRSC